MYVPQPIIPPYFYFLRKYVLWENVFLFLEKVCVMGKWKWAIPIKSLVIKTKKRRGGKLGKAQRE